MRIQKYNAPRKYQEGGAMPGGPAPMGEDPAMMQGGPQEAPMEGPQGGGEDAMAQQLQQVAQELISQMGPEVAMTLAQIIMEMVQGGGQGPVGQAPEGEPVFKRGGKICGRLRKGKKINKCGK